MTEIQATRRKIRLKQQAIRLIREDLKDLRFREKLLATIEILKPDDPGPWGNGIGNQTLRDLT